VTTPYDEYDALSLEAPWEPDEWDVINANEADDYRHENDEYAADDEGAYGEADYYEGQDDD
jgi:hypothetical protein